MARPDASPSLPEAATAEPPTLLELAACFARIALLSVGGGLAAWIRRLAVEQKRWLDEPHFLSGYALSQIAPGPNAVNLAVFVGGTLRGAPGAAASLAGLLLPPFVLVLALGALLETAPLPPWARHMLAGLGAGAIGLVLATALKMARTGIRSASAILVAAATALALALGAKLLLVVAVALPLALLLPDPARHRSP